MPRLALSPWIKDERNETKYQIIRWQSASLVPVHSSRNMILLEHCWLNGQERVVTGPFTWQPTENLVCRSQSSTARSRWFEGGKPSDLPFGVGVFSLPQKTFLKRRQQLSAQLWPVPKEAPVPGPCLHGKLPCKFCLLRWFSYRRMHRYASFT